MSARRTPIVRRPNLTAMLFAVLLACAAPVPACINTFDGDLQELFVKGKEGALQRAVAVLGKQYQDKPTREIGNDLAVAHLVLGKYPAAVALLRDVEARFPGDARVAANLGTALDLSGANTEALEWIKKGIERDANLHDGSEWLHARILTAKIALERDPRWLQKNRIVEIDFGNEDVPAVPEILPLRKDGTLTGAQELLDDIEYQILERTKFIDPPDAIVGDLHASSGDVRYAGLGADPTADYEAALKYGAPRAKLIRARLERFKADHPDGIEVVVDEAPAPAAAAPAPEVRTLPRVEQRRRAESRATIYWIVAGVVAALGLLGAAFVMDRRRRRLDAERERSLPPLPDV